MTARRAFLSIALATCIAACGNSANTQLKMTLKRDNLDLVYKNEALAKRPPTINQIIDDAPPTAAALTPNVFQEARSLPPNEGVSPPGAYTPPMSPPPDRSCRPAKPNAPAVSATTTTANGAPAVGTHGAHQTGTFDLQSPTLSLHGLVPTQTQVTIRNVKDTSTVDSSGRKTPNITFDEVVPGVGDPTITTYKIDDTDLQLMRIQSGSNVFQPALGIIVMQFKDTPGTNWTSVGVDLNTSESMTVQGQIVGRVSVDLCGTVVEAYRVSSQESRTNARTGFSYQTDPQKPKIYDVATQYGALFVRIQERSTTRFTVNGSPVTFTVDFTRTLDSPTPQP